MIPTLYRDAVLQRSLESTTPLEDDRLDHVHDGEAEATLGDQVADDVAEREVDSRVLEREHVPERHGGKQVDLVEDVASTDVDIGVLRA